MARQQTPEEQARVAELHRLARADYGTSEEREQRQADYACGRNDAKAAAADAVALRRGVR